MRRPFGPDSHETGGTIRLAHQQARYEAFLDSVWRHLPDPHTYALRLAYGARRWYIPDVAEAFGVPDAYVEEKNR